MPEKIHTALGQYFLQDKIAQGGMAEIYKGIALDIHGIKRTVVIKKILPHIAANKEFIDMLVGEAKIAVKLSHGNIAQIYDLGCVNNDYFMVMEYVEGRSLSQIHKRCLKDGRLIPLPYLVSLISDVANGLDYMHRKTDEAGTSMGIVHRDISPQNLIVSYSGIIKIIDFGIAKAAFKIDSTEAGVLKGKFAYMSPEQARGEDIDGRSDIFSLGVILHEMSTGRRLFKEKDNKATIRNVRRAEVHAPSIYNPEIPKELDAIVLKALARNQEKRYQHAGDFSNELARFLYRLFPDFKSSAIADFIAELFAGDAEELKETEHTPVLIMDQTQSAINAAGPQVMKSFMLDEKSVSEKPKIEEPPEITGPGILERIRPWLEKVYNEAKAPVVRYAPIAAGVLMLAAIIFGGAKLGFWRAWSDFFRPVSLTEGVKKGAAITKFTTIILDSRPSGGTLFIDDRETRLKTPATIQDFKADGKIHHIGIYLEGHRYFSTTFTAAPDDTIRFNPVLAVAYGSIEINFEPAGARVIINDEPAGQTPFVKEQIEPGAVLKIRVEADGYFPWEDNIKINADKAIVLRAALARQPKKPGAMGIPIPKIEVKTETKEIPHPESEAPVPEPAFEQMPTTEPANGTLPLPEDMPLLPAEPALQPVLPTPEMISPIQPPLETSAPPESQSTTPPNESVQPDTTPLNPATPGAPTPESRDNPLKLDYLQEKP